MGITNSFANENAPGFAPPSYYIRIHTLEKHGSANMLVRTSKTSSKVLHNTYIHTSTYFTQSKPSRITAECKLPPIVIGYVTGPNPRNHLPKIMSRLECESTCIASNFKNPYFIIQSMQIKNQWINV